MVSSKVSQSRHSYAFDFVKGHLIGYGQICSQYILQYTVWKNLTSLITCTSHLVG